MLRILKEHVERHARSENIIEKIKMVAVRTPYSIDSILELSSLITDMALIENIDPSAMLVRLKTILMEKK